MHEYSIVHALIERVGIEARGRKATRVHKLHVSLGSLSSVDPALLATAYQTFREKTICQGAELELHRVSALWACPRCERPIARGAPLQCPLCGTAAMLLQGDELVLERIEMEVA